MTVMFFVSPQVQWAKGRQILLPFCCEDEVPTELVTFLVSWKEDAVLVFVLHRDTEIDSTDVIKPEGSGRIPRCKRQPCRTSMNVRVN